MAQGEGRFAKRLCTKKVTAPGTSRRDGLLLRHPIPLGNPPGQRGAAVQRSFHNGIGRLHFAGEHTYYKFVGYMEGALNSGTSLARRIAKRDGVAK